MSFTRDNSDRRSRSNSSRSSASGSIPSSSVRTGITVAPTDVSVPV
jgi:hypothetical protein